MNGEKMNRPSINDEKYKFPHNQFANPCLYELRRQIAYKDDLEKYCDELEIKIKLKEHQRQNWEHDYKGIESYYKDCLTQREKVLIEWSNEYHNVCDEKDKYKRALDKAYKFIDDSFSACPLEKFGYELKNGCEGVCKERTEDSSLCWKEYLEEIEDE